MSEPLIMPVKPGAITPGAKRKLEKAGVIVVECENPLEIRLIKPWVELSGSDLLMAAMRTIGTSTSDGLKARFVNQCLEILEIKAGEKLLS